MLTKMVNGVSVTLSAAEEAEIKAEWAANEIASSESARLKAISDEAGLRIALMIPGATPPTDKYKVLEREMNMVMLNAELDDIKIDGGVLTVEQQAQKAFFKSAKDKIKLIRDMSNAAELAGDTVDKFKADGR